MTEKPRTPLYDALMNYAKKDPARFHMPGHKGRAITPALVEGMVELDVTEVPGLGNLYGGHDVIAEAEALWAEAWEFAHCQFLTGGSTQGLHAALLLASRRGRGILVDRCCHRSVYNALGLFDLEPSYLLRAQDRPVDPDAVARALDEDVSIKTVCITSPTYYGVLSDIEAIGRVCRERDVVLVVDGAHGCHLPFLLEENPFQGAHLVVSSAHKTLPVYGQGALLFSDEAFSADDLRWAASVCGTSSPSYLVMASLDWAWAWMESEEGQIGWRRARKFSAACQLSFRTPSWNRADPYRLVLYPCPGTGLEAKAELESMGVFCEMADRDHVVFILTGADTAEDYTRLWRILELSGQFITNGDNTHGPMPLPPEPEVVLSPARALKTLGARRPLAESEGWISLEQVAPYPPGVPVIAPGELITKKGLAYLREVGYNVSQKVSVRPRMEEKEA